MTQLLADPPGNELYSRWLRLPNRLQHLALVLWVSFAPPVVASTYYVLGGTVPAFTPMRQSYRLMGSLVAEVSSLMVLWYVMGRQGRTKNQIGWSVSVVDIPRALGLFVFIFVVRYFTLVPFQYGYRAFTGHFLTAKSISSMFGFGISFLSVTFVCLNPFFEELIVRAYAMTEIMSLGGTRTLAVIVSVIVQISYHLYQGLAHVLGLTIIFVIFAVYFAQTRRIVPVILAHLCLDLLGLLRGTF